MKTIEIKGSLRTEVSKKISKDLRKTEMVPCIIYGADTNINFAADELEFKKLLFTPNVYTVKLDVDGKAYKAILRETQFHPVTDKLIHADFQLINEDKKMIIALPIQPEGTPVGVQAGGQFTVKMRKLRVKGFIKDMPDTLAFGVKELTIGKAVKVRDLSYPNLEIVENQNNVVVAVNMTRTARKQQA